MTKSCKNITVCKAGFAKRLGAFLFDAMIVGFLARMAMTISVFLPIVVSALYFSLLESGKYSATYGKRFFHIKVVDYKTHEKISFLRAFIRHIMKMISISFCGIGYFPLLVGRKEEKMAFPDMICGTDVIVE